MREALRPAPLCDAQLALVYAGTGSAGTPRRTMGSLGAVGEAPQMPGLPSVSQVESLGQLLIPTINRLQDLFNQARGSASAAAPSFCLGPCNSCADFGEVGS